MAQTSDFSMLEGVVVARMKQNVEAVMNGVKLSRDVSTSQDKMKQARAVARTFCDLKQEGEFDSIDESVLIKVFISAVYEVCGNCQYMTIDVLNYMVVVLGDINTDYAELAGRMCAYFVLGDDDDDIAAIANDANAN